MSILATVLVGIFDVQSRVMDHTCWIRSEQAQALTFEVPLVICLIFCILSLAYAGLRLRSGTRASRAVRNKLCRRHSTYTVAFAVLWTFPMLHYLVDDDSKQVWLTVADAITASGQAAVFAAIRLSEPGAWVLLLRQLGIFHCVPSCCVPRYTSGHRQAATRRSRNSHTTAVEKLLQESRLRYPSGRRPSDGDSVASGMTEGGVSLASEVSADSWAAYMAESPHGGSGLGEATPIVASHKLGPTNAVYGAMDKASAPPSQAPSVVAQAGPHAGGSGVGGSGGVAMIRGYTSGGLSHTAGASVFSTGEEGGAPPPDTPSADSIRRFFFGGGGSSAGTPTASADPASSMSAPQPAASRTQEGRPLPSAGVAGRQGRAPHSGGGTVATPQARGGQLHHDLGHIQASLLGSSGTTTVREDAINQVGSGWDVTAGLRAELGMCMLSGLCQALLHNEAVYRSQLRAQAAQRVVKEAQGGGGTEARPAPPPAIGPHTSAQEATARPLRAVRSTGSLPAEAAAATTGGLRGSGQGHGGSGGHHRLPLMPMGSSLAPHVGMIRAHDGRVRRGAAPLGKGGSVPGARKHAQRALMGRFPGSGADMNDVMDSVLMFTAHMPVRPPEDEVRVIGAAFMGDAGQQGETAAPTPSPRASIANRDELVGVEEFAGLPKRPVATLLQARSTVRRHVAMLSRFRVKGATQAQAQAEMDRIAYTVAQRLHAGVDIFSGLAPGAGGGGLLRGFSAPEVRSGAVGDCLGGEGGVWGNMYHGAVGDPEDGVMELKMDSQHGRVDMTAAEDARLDESGGRGLFGDILAALGASRSVSARAASGDPSAVGLGERSGVFEWRGAQEGEVIAWDEEEQRVVRGIVGRREEVQRTIAAHTRRGGGLAPQARPRADVESGPGRRSKASVAGTDTPPDPLRDDTFGTAEEEGAAQGGDGEASHSLLGQRLRQHAQLKRQSQTVLHSRRSRSGSEAPGRAAALAGALASTETPPVSPGSRGVQPRPYGPVRPQVAASAAAASALHRLQEGEDGDPTAPSSLAPPRSISRFPHMRGTLSPSSLVKGPSEGLQPTASAIELAKLSDCSTSDSEEDASVGEEEWMPCTPMGDLLAGMRPHLAPERQDAEPLLSQLYFSGALGTQVGTPRPAKPGQSPAQRGSSALETFEVVSLADEAFATLRRAAGLSTAHIVSMLDPHALRLGLLKAHFSDAGSSSFFCRSLDQSLVVKTLTKTEVEVLMHLLPAYIAHLRGNPGSLLCRFYGCFGLKLQGAGRVWFALMGNVFPATEVGTHAQTFDLKGSTVGRSARMTKSLESRDARGRVVRHGVLMQDTDFRRLYPRGLPALCDTTSKSVLRQLQRDARLLAAHGMMDYSLLVNVIPLASPRSTSSLARRRVAYNDPRALRRAPDVELPLPLMKREHLSFAQGSRIVRGVARAARNPLWEAADVALAAAERRRRVPRAQKEGDDEAAATSADHPAGHNSAGRAPWDWTDTFSVTAWSPMSMLQATVPGEEGEPVAGAAAPQAPSQPRPQQSGIAPELQASLLGADSLADSKAGPGGRVEASVRGDAAGDGGGGGLAELTRRQHVLLQVGVIDFLQTYDTRKALEHGLKVLRHADVDVDVSAVNPDLYVVRFLKFVRHLLRPQLDPCPGPGMLDV